LIDEQLDSGRKESLYAAFGTTLWWLREHRNDLPSVANWIDAGSSSNVRNTGVIADAIEEEIGRIETEGDGHRVTDDGEEERGLSPWEPAPLQKCVLGLLAGRHRIRRRGTYSYKLSRDEEPPKSTPATSEAIELILKEWVTGPIGTSINCVKRTLSGLKDKGLVKGREETRKAGWRLTEAGEDVAKQWGRELPQ